VYNLYSILPDFHIASDARTWTATYSDQRLGFGYGVSDVSIIRHLPVLLLSYDGALTRQMNACANAHAARHAVAREQPSSIPVGQAIR